jgi:hypothetical protein
MEILMEILEMEGLQIDSSTCPDRAMDGAASGQAIH